MMYGGLAVLLLLTAAFGIRVMRQRGEVAKPEPPAVTGTQTADSAPSSTPSTPAVPAVAAPDKPSGSIAPATAAPAVVAKGELTIATVPVGASVKLDGKKLTGATPLTQKDLAAGKHTFQISLPGYLTALKSVEVKGGEAATETVTLVAAQGIVKLSSVPPGADIFLDGTAANKKTPAEFSLPKGDHTFMVRMQGYGEAGDLIHVTPGETVSFAPTLLQARKSDGNPFKKMGKFFAGDEKGTLSVTTDPAGAFVFINGRRIPGQTPLNAAVPTGKFFMAIRKPGFAPVQKTVTIEKGKPTSISQTLTAKEE
jgi:hypothetical protein